MSFDPILLARLQFAANISFHILFPTITIALGWLLLYFKLRYRRSADPAWMQVYGFFVKVFALSFALGVVSGVTMSFQFGTNWPGYMMKVGNVAGPLLAYEVLTAFFLEASFLGVMLFGRQRVGERMHTLATFLVAFGTSASAFWILALNSWMQTPAGVEWVEGQAVVTDWFQVVFNPSFPYRLAHVLLASGLTCAFLVAGLSAYRWLRGDRGRDVRLALGTGVWLAALLIPVQVLVGDMHGLNTLQHQPAKIAAMEGIWHDERGAPALLFAWPNQAEQRNDFAIGVPKLASLILTHELEGEIKGLSSFPDATPPVAPVFFAFRVMVGMGVLMWLLSWWGAWHLWRQRRTDSGLPGLLMKLLVWMSFSGWVATLAGWYVTEVGRQPFMVYGMLRTAEAASSVPGESIALSLALYLLLYLGLLIAYVSVLFHMAAKQGRAVASSASPEVAHG
ncbi:cytochrome ubiquinol oxidase subunit I [Pseudomarimonas arenosa]|uniref:Cytochrome ubiquinol oxidase subunit I n=1 Tax=Pseudomarimonas arenosa TaxID=2774145 RepID=A0AAW3ZQW3_9GAMM|nr:cytochrome ubiquinol oxidase subunit I [Pseudomarimonas arenosa]MBD8527930.1 cytochrome ubiquinol oxidase subunit I [Pseudomarimonas arenosa]